MLQAGLMMGRPLFISDVIVANKSRSPRSMPTSRRVFGSGLARVPGMDFSRVI
jgi:hypothetical protein